ncbi:MAG: branched-chain amino acid ABC transporter permease [Methylobacteriaceae bacterium]|nr:branched-chain amino acid ABC transporter permease [Methylobacteriaceae bacterium]
MVLICAALAALGGCAANLDADQARLCRTILPVLHPAGAFIRVLRQLPATDGLGLRVDYTAQEPGRPTRNHFAECRFGGGPQSPDRRALVSLTTERGPFGEAGLLFLKRFWLETSEAGVSDPSPVPGAENVGEVSREVAYGLQQAVNALPLAAIYGLLAAAYSLVYGLVGRINLAFGEFAAAGGYGAFFGMVLVAGLSPAASIALAALLATFTATLHGIVVGRLVFQPLSRATGQQVLVATVGLSLFLQEYLRLTQGANLIWVSPVFATPIALVRAGDFVTTVTPISLLVAGFAALAASALLAIMRHTRFGRAWRAYADDPKAAVLFGVDPDAVLARTFALASLLAGLSGYVMTIFYGGVGYGASTTLGLKALIAAILGGIGSVRGAFYGGIAIGGMEALWSALFPIVYRDLAIYVLLVALLIWRPGGFLGYGKLTPRQV